MDTLTPPHLHALNDFTYGSGVIYSKRSQTTQQVPARARVRPALIPWKVPFPNYQPSYFVAHDVLENSGHSADPEDITVISEEDPLIGRPSYEGALQFDPEGYPRNPRGRTGMRGRGKLYRWGPNFASDPVVVREPELGRYQVRDVPNPPPQSRNFQLPPQTRPSPPRLSRPSSARAPARSLPRARMNRGRGQILIKRRPRSQKQRRHSVEVSGGRYSMNDRDSSLSLPGLGSTPAPNQPSSPGLAPEEDAPADWYSLPGQMAEQVIAS